MQAILHDIADIIGVPGDVMTSAFADFQWSGAFRQAKIEHRPPRQIAEEVADRALKSGVFSKVEVAGAGFVNLHLDFGWLAQRVQKMGGNAYLGIPQTPEATCVFVDFSSPNIAKRMHVAHLRSTVIGNAIANLYRATGHAVVTDNHVGDWGTQFGKLLVAWDRWSDAIAFRVDPVGELERLYIKFNKEEDEDETEALENEAREMLCVLQGVNSDPHRTEAVRQTWKLFYETSMEEYQQVYATLNVKFDLVLGESHYDASARTLIKDLVHKGVAVSSDGAIIIPAPDGAQEPPMLIQKSDGCVLYASTDLACLWERMKDCPVEIIYVTDVRQELHFRQLFRVAHEHLGVDPSSTKLTHIGFGLLQLPENQGPMASRKGNAIPLMDLLDESYNRAYVVVDTLQPNVSVAEKEKIATAVGVSALIYNDLKRDCRSNIEFDWDECMSLTGNTATYLLYTLARLHGITRRVGALQLEDGWEIQTPSEKELCLTLIQFGGRVQRAQETHSPHLLASYLYELAGAATDFYHLNPVLRDGVPNHSRLKMVLATIDVLTRGCTLLGLHPLTQM